MSNRYLWIDFETTGLDPEKCAIVEVAAILTEGPAAGYTPIDTYYSLVDDEGAPCWSQYTIDMHTKTGLLADLAAGPAAKISDVEAALLKKIVYCKRPILAARNPQFERAFIASYMPKLDKRLHYRHHDVTTICQIDPTLYGYDHGVEGAEHRARFDIHRDLQYAREFARRYNKEENA